MHERDTGLFELVGRVDHRLIDDVQGQRHLLAPPVRPLQFPANKPVRGMFILTWNWNKWD